jgi:tetrahydromethanopterin S-methyltransferase subunit C
VSYTDPRLTGGLLMQPAPALDRAGVETTSEPEPIRARAVRVFWHVAVVAELVALRVSLPPQASRQVVDSYIVAVGLIAAIGVLSAFPWLHWLENVRPRPSRERSIRLFIAFVAIQVFVVSSSIMHETPGPLWLYGGFFVLVLTMVVLPPWIVDRWPSTRYGNGRTT